MLKQSDFIEAVQENEKRYGSTLNFPDDVVRHISQLAPQDNDVAKLSQSDHDALLYMVKRGDFSQREMAINLHHSQQWVRHHKPEIETELGVKR